MGLGNWLNLVERIRWELMPLVGRIESLFKPILGAMTGIEYSNTSRSTLLDSCMTGARPLPQAEPS